jgi:amidase
MKVDPEVAAAVEATGKVLAGMGHMVERASVDMGGRATLAAAFDIFFFGFDLRLDGYAKRSGYKVGPDTLEPVILSVYNAAKEITPARFIAATGAANVARRKLGAFYSKYDIWLSPTTSRPSEPWGRYNLSRKVDGWDEMVDQLFIPPCQYTVPHNIMGTPAMSLPLAMHSTGVPVGVQIAAKPAAEHLVLQLAAALEEAMPWRDRVPPLHVSRMG